MIKTNQHRGKLKVSDVVYEGVNYKEINCKNCYEHIVSFVLRGVDRQHKQETEMIRLSTK